ncbi:MAG: hypothetical protein U5L11_02530 [Arhodomonas sp.]|nr:hypothetical protein [Arhodomonas sp.]
MARIWLLVLALALPAPAALAADCGVDWWERELSQDRMTATYRGQVDAALDHGLIYVEVWRLGDLQAESASYVNPRGRFEVRVHATQPIHRRALPVFSCR